MDESGKDILSPVVVKERDNEALAARLEKLAEVDPEKHIHNPVMYLTHDRQADKPQSTKVGNIFNTGKDNTFVVVVDERGKKRILVITPKGPPGMQEPQDIEDFYNFIHFNRTDEPPHFEEDFSYSVGTLAYTDPLTDKYAVHTDLADYFSANEMLLAKSGTHQQDTVSNELNEAFNHGTQHLGLPEATW